ncbi:MAG: DUF4160 domain-containing protein [Cyanobacteria bacterium J06623_5]
MAEIFRIEGFQFYMPSNDHSPAHVRVRRAEFKTRIDISGEEARIMDNSGNKKLEKKALKIANKELRLLKSAWEKRPK